MRTFSEQAQRKQSNEADDEADDRASHGNNDEIETATYVFCPDNQRTVEHDRNDREEAGAPDDGDGVPKKSAF